MKKISVPLSALFIYCTVFFSCQKDGMENSLQAPKNKSSLEELKSYYQTETISSARGSKASKLAGPTTDLPEWEKALFSPEKNTYLIPVKMNASKVNKDILVSKFLVFTEAGSKKDGFFYYAIADVKTNKPISPQQVLNSLSSVEDGAGEIKKTGYTFVKASLHQNELFLKEMDKNAGKTGKYIAQKNALERQRPGGTDVAGFAPIETCESSGGTMVTIDWYYQIYVNGILVSETYVYSTSQCMGASGSGGGTGGSGAGDESACRQAASEFINSGAATSELISSSTGLVKPNFKTDRYDWKIFSAGTWGIISFDQVTWTRPATNIAWTYSSYSHVGHSEVGMSIGGTRTYKIISADAISYVSSVNVRIDFTVTHQPLCQEANIVIPAVTIPYNSNIGLKPLGVVLSNI